MRLLKILFILAFLVVWAAPTSAYPMPPYCTPDGCVRDVTNVVYLPLVLNNTSPTPIIIIQPLGD